MSDEHDDDALTFDRLLEGDGDGQRDDVIDQQDQVDHDHDQDHDQDQDYQIDHRQQQYSNKPTKEQFIDILARDEDESDEVHANDYSYVMAALAITTEPTLAKLACQAIDKVQFILLLSHSLSLTLSSLVQETLNGSSLPLLLSQIFSLEHLIVVLRSLVLKLLIASSSSRLLIPPLYQR
jgi:hypothetical protein